MKRIIILFVVISILVCSVSCSGGDGREEASASAKEDVMSDTVTSPDASAATTGKTVDPDIPFVPSSLNVELISAVEGNGNKWPTYGRVIELKHSGKKNGRLICTSQWAGKSFPVYLSLDGGRNWSLISEVKETVEPDLIGNWQPDIYELPCAVGDMPEGTLILGGCSHDDGTKTTTKISLWRSFNAGLTWEQFTEIDRGNGISDGMYEPFMICDEDGSLVVFYSDETEVSSLGGQRLVFKVSKDGVNWSEKKYCVAPKSKALRPGMVSVAKMGDEGYLIVYEVIGIQGGPVYYKTSKSLTEWDYASLGTKMKSTGGDITGCTPYCTWTPEGGSHGTVIACGRFGDINYKEQSKLFLSSDLGKTWVALENPLKWDYHQSSNANYAYSLGFSVSADGSVYHIANCFPSDAEKKYIHSELTLCRFQIS